MNNIKLIGSYLIKEDGEPFSPAGVHLRWNLPTNQSDIDNRMLGDGEGYSFTIFRQNCLSQDISDQEDLQKGSSLSDIDSFFNKKIIENSQILLQFKEPLVYFKLSLSQSSNYRKRITPYSRFKRNKLASMKVYYQNMEVACITDLKTLSIKNVQFDTVVLLTLGNSEINHIEFLTAKQYCNSENWGEELTKVNKITNENEIKKKLEGVINRYVPSDLGPDDIAKIYSKKLQALNSSIDNTTDDPPPVEIILDPQNDFRKIIHIAATDPNMARVLGLYYVDTTADPTEYYNYKIVGLEDEAQKECSLLLNVHGVTEALESPSLLEPKQARGFTWEKREPLAKVDLFWKPVVWSRNKIQPLYYDVKRDDELITNDAPIPSYRQKYKKDITAKHLFTDEPLHMGKHSYQSRSIDIFGRVSKYGDSIRVTLEDLLPPPPPVRLKAAVAVTTSQVEGEPDIYKGIFSFEYGYHQHKQAPDAKSIQLYWREYSLILRESGEVKSYSNFNNNKKIEFNNLTQNELVPFIGGTISLDTSQKIVRRRPVNIKAPNSQRQSYTIIAVEGNGVIIKKVLQDSKLLADDRFLHHDRCELRSAKENRANWIKLTFDTQINLPSANEVVEFLDPSIIFKHKYTNPDFLNDEVCINLDILEPDLFKNYTIEGKVIRFSTVGSDKDDKKPYLRARLGFDSKAISALSEDEKYNLVPPPTAQQIAVAKIMQYSNTEGSSSAPTVQDYTNAGVTGVPANNLDVVNNVVAGLTPEDVNTPEKIWAIVNDLGIPLPPHTDDNPWLVKAVQCTNPIQYDIIGGEVAFEFDKKQVIIARVVGYQRDDKYLLVKLTEKDLLTLRSGKVFATYYAPYLVSDKTINVLSSENNLPSDVPYWINTPETQVLKGYIAASAKDDRDNESELSLPVEVSTIKPANFPDLPKAPVSEIEDGARGLASPPDFEGKSFVKLLWLGNFEGYRLEIARVLDSTLVMGISKSWLNGENIDGPMIPTLPGIEGEISGTPELLSNGSIQVIFKPDELISDLKVFLNGRMKIKRLPAVSNECVKATEIPEFATFKIIDISHSQNDDEKLILILSPVNGKSEEFENNKLDKNTCVIDILPNFNNLAKIDAFLAMLANNPSNSDLFTIASKVPIPIENGGATFIDEIPGIGSNRFFYKVRLVDVADNRSDWSPCSMPVYQLDTTPPEPVKNLEIVNLSDDKSLLSWDVSDEKGLYGYSIAGEETAKEDLKYKQQATPLDQILFSKSIDIPLGTHSNYLMDALDSIQLSIIDIHKAEESLNLTYDYIYDIDDSNDTDKKLNIKGIFFYEKQIENLLVTVVAGQDGKTYISEGFDRNRWSYLLKSGDATEIYAIKKVSYRGNNILVKSKKIKIPARATEGVSNG